MLATVEPQREGRFLPVWQGLPAPGMEPRLNAGIGVVVGIELLEPYAQSLLRIVDLRPFAQIRRRETGKEMRSTRLEQSGLFRKVFVNGMALNPANRAMALMVVFAGPSDRWRLTVAAMMRCRVASWLSARRRTV